MTNKHGADVRRARLMNRTGGSGFKLVVVLGDAPRSPGRVRICVWSANQDRWSQPQTVSPDTLTAITYAELSSRHRKVVDDAMKHIRAKQGVVSWGKGVHHVGDPWCADRAVKARAPKGVTKLAPVTARLEITEISGKVTGAIVDGRMVIGEMSVSAADKKQVQQLNSLLFNALVGGKKP